MSELFNSALEALVYWWLFLPLAAFAIARDLWLIHITERYIDDLKWVLLEIIIPKENVKSAKAMEQVITALHGTYSFGIKKIDRYRKGKVEDWMSLEIVGFSEGIHFFIRTQEGHRHLVESAVLSEYPDAEVIQVDDYVERLKEKPFSDRDIFGADFVLVKGDHLPLRTYPYFEDDTEERMLDPLATITEVMSRLKNNEAIWLQILIQPTGSDWQKKAQEEIDDIIGVKKAPAPSVLSSVAKDAGDVLKNLPTAMIEPPVFDAPVEAKAGNSKPPSPASQEKIKAIYNKTSKSAFDTLVRFIYIDDKDEFTPENITAVMGAIRQMGDQNLNQLAPHKPTLTTPRAVGLFFRKKRLAKRKRMLMINYIQRSMPKPIRVPFADMKLKTSILNSEEVATLFHPPLSLVKSQRTQAIQSRKSQAPMDLPVKER